MFPLTGVWYHFKLIVYQAFSGFNAGMSAISVHIQTDRVLEADCIPDTFFESLLVAFDCQNIIGPLFDDFRGDVLLTTHRINGHDSPFDIKQGKQLGDGRDLVTFLLCGYLSQAQPAFGGEG